jgi:DNA repair protein RecN (Recombination protein N)
MLTSLLIKNYALIESLSVEFSPGLVIITGETGAGKSIIIDALGLVLGARASAEVVRSGADKSVVEAMFAAGGNSRLQRLLEENAIEAAEELIVRREVSSKGQSRCFVNDTPVTLALLKAIGELVVDLHGQHEHQSLLRVETHCGMVDDFGGLDGMVREFQGAWNRLRTLAAEEAQLREREQHLREKREFYAFQMQEIDAVAPQPGEEEALQTELTILENAERLFAVTGSLYTQLYEGDQSVHDQLVLARNQLQDLAGIDRQFDDAATECSSAVAIVNELAKFIQGYNARVEFNPERLEVLRDRLGRLALLKKKYGGSLDAVLQHRTTIGNEVALAEHFDDALRERAGAVADARAACARIAERLSTKRRDVAKKVDKAIVRELEKLGIRNGRFTTRVEQRTLPPGNGTGWQHVDAGKAWIALNARGYDEVEFYISTNLGEDERPLVKVASGGEVSRVMLAMKTILAKSDRLPVLIFDEIDVGVSGRIAQAVGQSLKSLSGFHQVLAITHLPQIAGLADAHFVVFKRENGARSTTSIRRLTLDEQVREVAALMSGEEVTEAGLAGAKELMGLRDGDEAAATPSPSKRT